MIEEVTPKQIGDEQGGRKKQNKTRQTNREESRQKEAGVEIACKGHYRQEGIRREKPRNKSKRNKPGQPHIIRVGRARKATIYIYKECKTTQIGRKGKDKDNEECATQRNKIKEEKGDSNQIK